MNVHWFIIFYEVVQFFMDGVRGVDNVMVCLCELCVWVGGHYVSFRWVL